MWDPYTGHREDIDPYGPLYFDPDSLIYTIWIKRLNNLWVEGKEELGYHTQGYYSDGVGAGQNFEIVGRGSHPEWYLFRLPIVDLYLTEDHNEQIPTMGPVLTDEEVNEIYELSLKSKYKYKNKFKNKRPNFILIKFLYDIAISKNPKKKVISIINKIDKLNTRRENKIYIKNYINSLSKGALCTCEFCKKKSESELNYLLNTKAVSLLKNI